jgi:hypothetical protein
MSEIVTVTQACRLVNMVRRYLWCSSEYPVNILHYSFWWEYLTVTKPCYLVVLEYGFFLQSSCKVNEVLTSLLRDI